MMFRYKFYNFKVINSLCKTLSYMKESHTIGYCDIEEYFIEVWVKIKLYSIIWKII